MIEKRIKIEKDAINKFSKEIGQSQLIAELLLQKNLDTLEKVDEYVNPSLDNLEPIFSYSGMEYAINRIKLAIENQERVVIYGDYDCDGVCAVSILYAFLSKFSVEIGYFIPNRNDDGYGLHIESLELIAEKFAPDLIITVDCGITAYEEVEYAKDVLGIDVIVTDHHEIAQMIPECIVINPKLDKDTAFPYYCGAGVALRLVEGLSDRETMLKYIDIAAIATIADMVPLIGDNRIIASLGIQKINQEKNKSIYLMAEMSGVKDKVTSTSIAFQLAPRLNALGRLSDATEAVDLFVSNDRKKVNNLIQKLDVYNKERQDLTKELTEHCIEIVLKNKMQNDNIIILYNKYWIAGILGITCSNLVKIFNKPVIILTKEDNLLKGSGRSINGINIFDVVSSARDLLESFGGHEMACGLSLEEYKIEDLKNRLNEYINLKYEQDIFIKKYEYDIELTSEINVEDVEFLENFEPYGMSNSRPKFLLNKDNGQFKFISSNSTSHIKEENEKFHTILFNKGSNINVLNRFFERQYIGNISLNVFNNKKTINYFPNEIHASFKNNMNNINEEEQLARFISGFKANKQFNEYKIELIHEEEQLIKFLNDGLFGTLFIANLKDTYENFLKLLENNNMSDRLICKNIYFLETETPYNSLILDPISNINLSYYQNVVFLDPLIGTNNLINFQFSKEIKVFSCIYNRKNLVNKIRMHMIDRDEFSKIFKNIRGIITKQFVGTMQELYDVYQNKFSKISQVSLYIVIYTLTELGIFQYINGRIIINDGIKSSLEKSVFLNNIKQYIETDEYEVI